MLPNKTTLITLVVVESILLFVLSILSNKVSNIIELPSSVLWGFSALGIGGLAYISYIKLKPTSSEDKPPIPRPQRDSSLSINDRILLYFTSRYTREKIDDDPLFFRTFLKSSIGTFVVTVTWFVIARKTVSVGGDSAFLLWLLFLVVIGVISAIPFFKGPTNTRYDSIGDVIEEAVGILFFAGCLFPLPGIFAATLVIWLLSWFI